MKKLFLSILITSFSISLASYEVVYPNQTVIFKAPPPVETFTPTDPLISEWSNVGEVYDCSNYTPEPSGYSYGVVFTQTSDNCKQNQERTIQQRQISSITNVASNVGTPTVENQTLDNQTNNKEATGVRYTHTMIVGNYNYGSTYYYGHFSDNYKSQYFDGFVTSTNSTLSPSSFRGSSIDHLMENNGNISMRVVPDITGSLPVITINGKSCTLSGPSVYTSYDGMCNFNLNNFVGQTIYIDLQ